MEKINVLWIEDNPLQEGIRVKALIKREPKGEAGNYFKISEHEYAIPAIHLEKERQDYHHYFNLQVLQHPLEIKDYISMCLQLDDHKGPGAFKEMEKVLPDIIVFDYHMSAKLAVNLGMGAISYFDRFANIRHFINPNFRFKKYFPQLFANRPFRLEDGAQGENEVYGVDDFLMEISQAEDKAEIRTKDRDDLDNDDFGLFSAVEILRIFRAHTTVAVPSTFNKRRVEQLSLHGKYFEWLNEYDLSIDFERPERGTKKWDEILIDAVTALQLKIAQQVRHSKLTPHLIQLSQLATGRSENSSNHRKVTFRNSYGVHQYPLDALFLNYPEGTEREAAIKTWSADLFQIGIEREDKNAENAIIFEAIKNAGRLWKAYQSPLFCDRLLFSKLHKIKGSAKGRQLSQELQDKYQSFLNGSGGFDVAEEMSSKNTTYYIIKNAVELKSIIPKTSTNLTTEDLAVLSWTALFVILKMFKGRADYLKAKQWSTTVMPSKKELLTVLFPIASTPVQLPIDNGEDKTMIEFMKKLFFDLDELVNGDANLFSEDRKFILRAYAESIGLSDDRFTPDWIKAI